MRCWIKIKVLSEVCWMQNCVTSRNVCVAEIVCSCFRNVVFLLWCSLIAGQFCCCRIVRDAYRTGWFWGSYNSDFSVVLLVLMAPRASGVAQSSSFIGIRNFRCHKLTVVNVATSKFAYGFRRVVTLVLRACCRALLLMQMLLLSSCVAENRLVSMSQVRVI